MIMRSPEVVESPFARLRALVAYAAEESPFYRAKLEGVIHDGHIVGRGGAASEADNLGFLRALPFTTRDELLADQQANPPYGTNLALPLRAYSRLHQTSGTSSGVPLRWLDTPASWAWVLRCWEEIYRAVGLRPDDRLFFPFSFGPFLGFWAAFEGASRLGNLCLPGGGMSSPARLRFMLDNAATVVCCTPTYAMRLAEVAEEEGIDLAASPVRALIVAGEPGGSVRAVRARIESAWGARVFDHTGMTEIGSLAIECDEAPGHVHLIESECIPEVLDPRTGEARDEGDGELVLTNLGRTDSPLLRYRTGDLVRLRRGTCACGRTWAWMEGGILGRLDDMIIIKGNNVYPAALDAVIRTFAEVAEYRATIEQRLDGTRVRIEIEPAPSLDDPAALARRVRRAIRDTHHFGAEVVAVAVGSLPRFEMKAMRFVVRPIDRS